jgi:hypothetical protein
MTRFEHVVETVATRLERDPDFGWFAVGMGLVCVALVLLGLAR